MNDHQHLPPDNESVPMAIEEYKVWVYLVTVAVTSGGYFALIASRLARHPVEEVSWVAPMVVAIVASVSGTVLGAIALGALDRGRRDSDDDGPHSDIRDQEIERSGTRASTGAIGVGFGAALVLAMLDFDTFWIGNLLFLFGTLGAVVETTTKIRLYRWGF